MEERAFELPEETKAAGEVQVDASAVGRKVGYIVTVLVNFGVLWVFRRLGALGAPIVTAAWAQVLPAFEISIGATIVANLIYLFYDARWYRRLAQIGLNVLGLRAMWAVYRIFPFALGNGPVEAWVRIGLMVVIGAMALATLVEAVKLVTGSDA